MSHEHDHRPVEHLDEDHTDHPAPIRSRPVPRHGGPPPASPPRQPRRPSHDTGTDRPGLGLKLHGHSSGLIRRPRLYECGAAIGFLGRRRRVYDDLVARSGARPGDQLLDIGCGTGYFTRRAARAVTPGGHAIGIDPSRPMIDDAARRAPANCTFQQASAQALPYPDASFDVVISSLAIHHLPPDDRPLALGEAYRVLRPGGRLLVADFRPPRNRVANNLIGALTGHAMQHNPIGRLADLITQAGFEITGSGDRWPWLHYVQARRPTPGS